VKSLFRLQVLLDLADKMSGPLSTPIKRIQEFANVSDLANRSLENFQAGMTLTGIGVAFAAPLALATQEAIGFEEAFSDARKVIDFPTPQAPKELQMDLLEMSNQIPRTASDLTQIAAAAGSAGIAFGELTPFVKDASEMSVAFGITADVAGDTMAKMRNVFHLTQPEVRAVGDAVNALGNTMAAEAPGILDVLRRIGGTGDLVGMSAQQLAAFGAAMLSTGTAPEVVATGMNALILKLATARQGSKDFQSGLKDLGLSAKGVEQAMRKDASGALLGFLKIVSGNKDKISVLGKMFGAEYADDIAKLVGALPLVQQGLKLVGDQSAIAGSMHAEYAIRADTAANKIQLLGNRVKSTGILIGQVALERIKPLIDKGLEMLDWIFKVARANPELIGTLVTLIGVLAAVPAAAGLVIMALSAIGTAAGQAKVGLAFLKLMVSTTRLGFINAWGAITGFTSRLIIMGATAQGVSADLLAMNGMTNFQALKFALVGVRVGLLQAARAAWTFTVSLLTNPIFLAVAAIVALGAAFIWAWNNVKVFRDNVLAVLEPLKQAWNTLVDSVSVLGDSFAPIGAMLNKALGPAATALDVFAYWVGFVLGFVFTLFVIVFAEIGVVVLDGIRGIILMFSGFVDWIVGTFTGDLDKAQIGWNKMVQGFKLTLGNGLQWIVDRANDFALWLIQKWHDITAPLAKPIHVAGLAWDGLKVSLQLIWNWITTQAIPDFFNMGTGLGQGLMQGLTRAFSNLLPNAAAILKRDIGNLVQTVRGATNNLLPNAVTTGKNLGQGIVTGIGGTLNSLKNAGKNAVGAASDGAVIAGDIHSPSRLFAYYGAMLMAGLSLGILNNTSSVQDAVVRAIPTVPAIEAPYITRLSASEISAPSITRLAELAAPEEAQVTEKRRSNRDVQAVRQARTEGIVVNNHIIIQSAPDMRPAELEAMMQRSFTQAMADALELAAQKGKVRRAS
jgi:TP901 family phage tail tape measure protein